MKLRLPAILAASVAATAFATGCASTAAPASVAVATDPGAPVTASVAAASDPASPSSAASAASAKGSLIASSPSPSRVAPRPSASPAHAVCPVSAATLVAAIARNPKVEAELAQPYALQTPTCYQKWATALTAPEPGLDSVVVVFGYDDATRRWDALNVGSSEACTGFVPASAAAHLPQCV